MSRILQPLRMLCDNKLTPQLVRCSMYMACDPRAEPHGEDMKYQSDVTSRSEESRSGTTMISVLGPRCYDKMVGRIGNVGVDENGSRGTVRILGSTPSLKRAGNLGSAASCQRSGGGRCGYIQGGTSSVLLSTLDSFHHQLFLRRCEDTA